MFCNYCGWRLPEGSERGAFCSHCGGKIPQRELVYDVAHTPLTSVQPANFAQQPSQESGGEEKSPKMKSGGKGKWIAVTAGILVLAVMAGLLASHFLFGAGGMETIYVLTKETYLDSDGLEISQYEYTYDDAARVLSETYRIREGHYAYDASYDVEVWVVDEDCDFEIASLVEYSYDEQGNLTANEVIEAHVTYIPAYEYDYRYTKDGQIRKYTQTLSDANLISTAEYEVEYDENGNITLVTYLADSYSRVVAAYEYDRKNRLVREIVYDKTQIVRFDYSYDQEALEQIEIYTAMPNPVENPNYKLIQEIILRYDENGLTRVTSTDPKTGSSTSMKYSYDSKGRLDKKDNGEKIRYECDKHGNVICAEYESGARIEYEYKKMKVSQKDAELYRRRAASNSREYWEFYRAKVSDPVYYCLIPNPLAEIIKAGKIPQ